MKMFKKLYFSFLVHLIFLVNNSSSKRCVCGKQFVEERIVGGTEVIPHSYRWMAALANTTLTGVFCGGALINDRYILTAGHCLAPKTEKNLKVLLGAHDFSRLRDARVYQVKEFIIHKKYDLDSSNQKWDIGLIRLKRRVVFSDTIKPVCLPSANFTDEFNHLFVAGWGKLSDYRGQSARLLEAVVPQLNPQNCSDLLGGHRVTNDHLCAGTSTSDSCEGDSGGPLMARVNGSIYQVGLVSWGMKCGHHKYPGVYTKVRSYLDWILENTKDATYCRPAKKKKLT